VLTIENVNQDTFGLSVGRVALIATGVGRPSFLDKQEACGRLPLLCDDTDATTRRIVTDYLQTHRHNTHIDI
jgi:hypothetical protein